MGNSQDLSTVFLLKSFTVSDLSDEKSEAKKKVITMFDKHFSYGKLFNRPAQCPTGDAIYITLKVARRTLF